MMVDRLGAWPVVSSTDREPAVLPTATRSSSRAEPVGPSPLRRGFLSLTAKLALIFLVFALVPVILYIRFKEADEEKQNLLLAGLHVQAQIVAQALTPLLEEAEVAPTQRLREQLELLAGDLLRVKLLFRPNELGETMFYMASAPGVSSTYLEEERALLERTGVLSSVDESCMGARPLGLRYTNPAGHTEVLTSLAPVITSAGCWLIITSQSLTDAASATVSRDFAESEEVQIAFMLYGAIVLLTLMIGVSIVISLRRFAKLAQEIGNGEGTPKSFVAANRVPELAGVAHDFDRMVRQLADSAEAIRAAAEDTAKAFEAPVAAITRSLEPILRSLRPEDARAQRAVDTIRAAVARVETLVAASQRMDQAEADLINPHRRKLDLVALAQRLVDAYMLAYRRRRLHFECRAVGHVKIRGGQELVQGILENLLDNAASYSPDGGRIVVTISQADRIARLTVEDEGPGVEPADLERIFERYYSQRADQDGSQGEVAYLGIGLWIVRRSVEALGGNVAAENRESGGLQVKVVLPLAH